MVGAGALHVPGARNVPGNVSTGVHARHSITLAMHDQGWDTNDRQHMARVGGLEHAQQCLDPGRAHSQALEPRPGLTKGLACAMLGAKKSALTEPVPQVASTTSWN